MEIAGKLIDYGADPRFINDEIYYSAPARILKLQGILLSGMQFYQDGKICFISLEKNMLNGNIYNPSDTEGMAEYSLYNNKVMLGAFLREISNTTTKISLRSRNPYNVSRLAHKYGGGGHINASGFTVQLSINEAREKLLAELKEMINAKV
jgi:phosphoesterase RecJ-like protein